MSPKCEPLRAALWGVTTHFLGVGEDAGHSLSSPAPMVAPSSWGGWSGSWAIRTPHWTNWRPCSPFHHSSPVRDCGLIRLGPRCGATRASSGWWGGEVARHEPYAQSHCATLHCHGCVRRGLTPRLLQLGTLRYCKQEIGYRARRRFVANLFGFRILRSG